jgi:hypothetical protein
MMNQSKGFQSANSGNFESFGGGGYVIRDTQYEGFSREDRKSDKTYLFSFNLIVK